MFQSCSQCCKTTKKLHKIVIAAKRKGEALEASNVLMGRCPRTSDPTGYKWVTFFPVCQMFLYMLSMS